ncbi:hypothetical protein VPNG_10360 [Cytospora leucostoma]|uniref:Ubiquitin-like protease family profile domain-containing protein n=1 Tax=Cytospora leucostoma TaxID=1230097 RepID=A0A423VCB9_9PEZI|nr:hypothetical protein VPNG_10360 [Cytospora leucostoma]
MADDGFSSGPSPSFSHSYVDLVATITDSKLPRDNKQFPRLVRQTLRGYPESQRATIAQTIGVQVPRLSATRRVISRDTAKEARQRSEKNTAFLDAAWRGDGWMPGRQFRPRDDDEDKENKGDEAEVGSMSMSMSFNEKSYMRSLTALAQKHHIALPSLWQPGGVLYAAMAERDAQNPCWFSGAAKRAGEILKWRLEQNHNTTQQQRQPLSTCTSPTSHFQQPSPSPSASGNSSPNGNNDSIHSIAAGILAGQKNGKTSVPALSHRSLQSYMSMGIDRIGKGVHGHEHRHRDGDESEDDAYYADLNIADEKSDDDGWDTVMEVKDPSATGASKEEEEDEEKDEINFGSGEYKKTQHGNGQPHREFAILTTERLEQARAEIQGNQQLHSDVVEVGAHLVLRLAERQRGSGSGPEGPHAHRRTHLMHPLWLRLGHEGEAARDALPACLPRHIYRDGNDNDCAVVVYAPMHHSTPYDHWTLACIDAITGLIRVYDPLPSPRRSAFIRSRLEQWGRSVSINTRGRTDQEKKHRDVDDDENGDEAREHGGVCVEMLDGPVQQDGVSCGVFILLVLYHLLLGIDPSSDGLKLQEPAFRRLLLDLIRDEMDGAPAPAPGTGTNTGNYEPDLSIIHEEEEEEESRPEVHSPKKRATFKSKSKSESESESESEAPAQTRSPLPLPPSAKRLKTTQTRATDSSTVLTEVDHDTNTGLVALRSEVRRFLDSSPPPGVAAIREHEEMLDQARTRARLLTLARDKCLEGFVRIQKAADDAAADLDDCRALESYLGRVMIAIDNTDNDADTSTSNSTVGIAQGSTTPTHTDTAADTAAAAATKPSRTSQAHQAFHYMTQSAATNCTHELSRAQQACADAAMAVRDRETKLAGIEASIAASHNEVAVLDRYLKDQRTKRLLAEAVSE